MKTTSLGRRAVLAGIALGLASPVALAADYPERAVDVIVAFQPGGGTDVAARSIQPFIEKYLGQQLVILNQPGAGGEVGFSLLAAAEPDGYTMGFINLPAMFAYSYTRETAYSPESFTPIANLVYDPGVIAVLADSAIQSVEDLVAHGKENPGALAIGTSGSVGSSEHIAILQMQSETGAKFNHVPFGGTAQLRTALLGGHIPAGAMNLSEAVDYQEEGAIRILGVMSEERDPTMPDVPTFKEGGVNVISGSSRGLAFPAGVPDDIVETMAEAVRQAIEDPEYVAKAKESGVPLIYLPPKAYAEFLSNTSAALTKAWENEPWVQ